MILEQDGHALQHVLDAALLLLVRVQDLEERLVRVWVVLEPSLDLRDVVNGMVELLQAGKVAQYKVEGV